MAPLLSEADYTRFRDLIMARTGLDFPPARRDDLASGLARVQADLDSTRYPGATSLEAVYAALGDSHSPVWDAVIDALTICETHFFRNGPHFEALRDHILPALIARRREAGTFALRLWSAGCASGEEAYSLAILLRESLPDWHRWQITILGSDINKRALEKARGGVYRAWSFREPLARHYRDRYFHRQGDAHRLQDNVRAMVRFEWCNLISGCPAVENGPPVDLILCRNVALYLGPESRHKVYRRLYDALAPDGWLLVGHADAPPSHFAAFEAHPLPGAIFYQRQRSRAQAVRPTTLSETRHASGNGQQPSAITLTGDRVGDADAHFRLGRWHADRQQWGEALTHCSQAIALNPTHSEAHYTLALIHQHLGAYDEAIEALRRTIYLAHDWALPRFTLAALYRETGQQRQAQRELRNVVAMTTNLPPATPISGSEGLTAARLRDAAERQLAQPG